MLYLDTSAVIPYYRPEQASNAVQRLLLGAKTPVTISASVEVEMASALARLVRMRQLDERSAKLIQVRSPKIWLLDASSNTP